MISRTIEWLPEVELEEIRRKIWTPRDAEENQKINDIPVTEERILNESGSIEPSETEIRVRAETKITDKAELKELKALMISNETEEHLPFKKVDQRKLRDVTKKVNALARHIKTDDVTQTNKLAMAAAIWTAKEVKVKKGKRGEKKEPWCKGRIESDITNLRRDINRLERERRKETGGKGKGNISESKQRLTAKKTKVKRYEQNISQFRQNVLFQVNQKQVYKQLNRKKNKVTELCQILKIVIKFWNDIWSRRKEHNQHAG